MEGAEQSIRDLEFGDKVIHAGLNFPAASGSQTARPDDVDIAID